jgi:hypothetical protein
MSAAAQLTDGQRRPMLHRWHRSRSSRSCWDRQLLGYVAERFGIRWSFGVGLPLVILSIVCAGALGTKPLKHEVE